MDPERSWRRHGGWVVVLLALVARLVTFGWWSLVPGLGPDNLLVPAVPTLVLAGGLVVVTGLRARVVAGACLILAAGLGPLLWARSGQASLVLSVLLVAVVAPTLVVLGWGIARRRGVRWLWGVAMVPVVACLTWAVGAAVAVVLTGLQDKTGADGWVVPVVALGPLLLEVVPMLVGGRLCVGLEREERERASQEKPPEEAVSAPAP